MEYTLIKTTFFNSNVALNYEQIDNCLLCIHLRCKYANNKMLVYEQKIRELYSNFDAAWYTVMICMIVTIITFQILPIIHGYTEKESKQK